VKKLVGSTWLVNKDNWSSVDGLGPWWSAYVVLALVQKLSGKMSFSMVGTIVSANRISCYVAVKRDLIYKDALYHIVLADGSTMDLSSSDFSDPVEEGYLTGFTIKHCD
jgi:hypothetical protein